MGWPWEVAKHVGAPLAVGGGLYALRAPNQQSQWLDEETLRHKWERARDAYGIGMGLAGLAGGHSLSKLLTNRAQKALTMIGGGVGGALLGTEVLAPAHHKEDVRIRAARAKYPGTNTFDPATGAPVFANPKETVMDPATAYSTATWGIG